MPSRIHLLFAFAAMALVAACGDDSATSPANEPAPIAGDDVTVLSPNGGETFKAGDSITVKWKNSEDSLVSAKITIQCGTGSEYALYGSSVTPDMSSWQNMKAKIPETLSGSCKITIMDYQMTWNNDTTDARFTVNPR